MNAAVRQHLQRQRQGLGFVPLNWGNFSEFGASESFDGGYSDWGDFYYGYGGESGFANPPAGYSYDYNTGGLTPDTPIGVDPSTGIDWNNFYPEYGWDGDPWQTPGINPDSDFYITNDGWIYNNGEWYDAYGNYWGPGGDTPDYTFDRDDGTIVVGTNEWGFNQGAVDLINTWSNAIEIGPDNSINLNDLQSTLDWWNTISGEPSVTLPAITYDAGYILNTPSTTLATDPNAPKSANGQKLSVAAWNVLKNALSKAAAKGGAAGGASGASAASKPPTTPPKPDGTCQQGYAKHPVTGVCTLIPPAPKKETDIGQWLKDNGMWVGFGALALIMLAKK